MEHSIISSQLIKKSSKLFEQNNLITNSTSKKENYILLKEN